MFPDECPVRRGAGQKNQYVLRYPHQKFGVNRVQPINKGKDMSVMVWTGIYYNMATDICRHGMWLNCTRGGYSADSYLESYRTNSLTGWMKTGFPELWSKNLHILKATNRLHHRGFKMLEEWPPYSPGLNPIEHLWPLLKEKLYKLYPDIEL